MRRFLKDGLRRTRKRREGHSGRRTTSTNPLSGHKYGMSQDHRVFHVARKPSTQEGGCKVEEGTENLNCGGLVFVFVDFLILHQVFILYSTYNNLKEEVTVSDLCFRRIIKANRVEDIRNEEERREKVRPHTAVTVEREAMVKTPRLPRMWQWGLRGGGGSGNGM